MKIRLLQAIRILALTAMGLTANFGLLSNTALATATYFCDGGGGGVDCALLNTGGGQVQYTTHTGASPALHEAWEGTLCGNNHVSGANSCPFNNPTLDNTYDGDNIVGIRFTNYANQCAAWSQHDDNYLAGATCGGAYSAFVRTPSGVYINVHFTNDHYSINHKVQVATECGCLGTQIKLEDLQSPIPQSQLWDNHQY